MSFFTVDSKHVPRPEGKPNNFASYVKYHDAYTAENAKSFYTDKCGRTKSEIEEHEKERDKFKRKGMADVAERRFTEGYDGKDAQRDQKKAMITVKLVEKNVIGREVESMKAGVLRLSGDLHSEPTIASAMQSALNTMRTAVRALPAFNGASEHTIATEISKICGSLHEYSDKQVLQSSLTEKESRVHVIQMEVHELQQQMKRLETDIAEVCKQWDDYKEFLTGSGDPQYQPHHWQGFSSDRPGSGGAAAALPHSSVAPPPPPEKKQKTTDTLLGTLMPRSCDDMLKAIDDKISNPAITRSSNLTPHGTHDRSIFAVRMDWLSKQMAKATFQKDNPGAQPSTDEDIKNISYAGFMAMGDFLMLDDMELKRFFSWIGNGKSDALTQEEVRALVTETYLRVNVYAFLMTKEKRSFERADSDASQVFA
jgi:hypothetical protein